MASNRVLNCGSRSTSRLHGAPQCGHAFSGEPARIHGSIRSGGNTAKCAPLNGFVETVQTVRLLRLLKSLVAAPVGVVPSPLWKIALFWYAPTRPFLFS